ncbi:MAG: 16S rRNA (cytidine(1402)-2'-O)-methyltransferase [Clostridia bacterium]
MTEKNKIKKGALYIVGTPIGNLSDFSPRAVNTLTEVDFIAAEDTRVTVKILNHFEIKKPLISYFEHNKIQKGDYICQRILDGESCALVSDAGMPAISDPGELLVSQCAEKGIEVFVVPGPTAVISALALSALPTGRFTFEGFLTTNKRNRKFHLNEIKDEKRTMVFYEAPHKMLNTLKDFYEVLGDRKISIVKEITKLHENVMRTSLEKAVEYYTQNTAKGEFVLVIDGANIAQEEQISLEQAVNIAKELILKGKSSSEAAKETAVKTGYKKGDIYKLLINN